MNNNLTFAVGASHMTQNHYTFTTKFNNTVLEYDTPGEGSDNTFDNFLHRYGHLYKHNALVLSEIIV